MRLVETLAAIRVAPYYVVQRRGSVGVFGRPGVVLTRHATREEAEADLASRPTPSCCGEVGEVWSDRNLRWFDRLARSGDLWYVEEAPPAAEVAARPPVERPFRIVAAADGAVAALTFRAAWEALDYLGKHYPDHAHLFRVVDTRAAVGL